MATRRMALTLYRKLLREAEKLPSYNFREYALRKIKDSYRENRTVTDFDQIDRLVEVGKQNLQLIRRQAIIGHMYATDKLVIEKKKTLQPSDD